MASAAVSPEALDLLQQYSIDVKDYVKAAARYRIVVTEELVAPKGEAENAELQAATADAQAALKAAWEEYRNSVQLYFGRLARGLIGDLVASYDASCAPPPPPPPPPVPMPEMPSSPPPLPASGWPATATASTAATAAAALPEKKPVADSGPVTPLDHQLNPDALTAPHTAAASPAGTAPASPLTAPVSAAPPPPLEPVIHPPGGAGLAGSAHPAAALRALSPLGAASLSSSQRLTAATSTSATKAATPSLGASTATTAAAAAPSTTLTLAQRAEKMNDLCALMERWYMRHEAIFQLPDPSGLARVAVGCIASVSRVLRLLGLRVAYVSAGSVEFLRAFVEVPNAAPVVGLCGDRELNPEVEGFLNLVDRMTAMIEQDAKAFPRIPFGWIYRVGSFLNPLDPMPDIQPRRRSLAIRVALRLLQVCPAQATAASLHSILLRHCLTKGGATPEEMASVVKLLISLFDTPATRQYIQITDISVIFAPFFETNAAPTATAVQENLVVLNLAKDMIVALLSSWVGSLWIFCETTTLRALIDVMQLPGDVDRKIVIFTLFNHLFVRLAPHRGIVEMDTWMGAEEDRRRRASAAALSPTSSADFRGSQGTFPNNSVLYDAYFSAGMVPNGSMVVGDEAGGEGDFIPTTKALGYHVLDPLLGRVLAALAYHGLPMALIDMLQNTNRNRAITDGASRLLQDLFVLMDTTLPKQTVHGLHKAFNCAVGRLANAGSLFLGGLTSQLFHTYRTTKSRHNDGVVGMLEVGAGGGGGVGVGGGGGGVGGGGGGGGGTGGAAAAGATMMPATGALQTMTGAFGTLDMDDPTFVAMLRDTQVEQNPTRFDAWDYDRLLALVQGPLRVRRRLRAARGILKTLATFYSPRDSCKMFFMRTFSSLSPSEARSDICVLGIELVDLLLSTREGSVLLDDASFLQGISLMLEEVRAGRPVILNKDRVNARIGQSLLRMAGRLSCYANGLVVMREYDIFSTIDSLFSKLHGERVTSPRPEDTIQDVCFQMLQYLFLSAVPNYGVCDEIRHTFQEALRSDSNAIRLCATMQLRKAVWRDLSTSLKWGIQTLVRVLSDDFYSVVESAFKLLLSICLCSDEGLDYLISLSPTVLLESDMILGRAKQLHLDVLLYRIAGRPAGFRFLQRYRWIEQELHRWEAGGSVSYLLLIEKLQAGEVDFSTVLGADGRGGSSIHHGATRSGGGRHGRSYSGMLSGGAAAPNPFRSAASPASPTTTGILPLMTADTAVSANFFPVHFAAVLCGSEQGCAMLRESGLWRRTEERIFEQLRPPRVVLDDSSTDSSGGDDDDDDDDMNVNGEMAHVVAARPNASAAAHQDGYGGAYGGNSMSRGRDNSFMQASLANRRPGAGASVVSGSSALGGGVGVVGGGGGGGAAAGVGSVGGPGGEFGAAGAAAALGAARADVGGWYRGGGGCNGSNGNDASSAITAREMRQLRKGKISRNDTVLLSAARGYKPLAPAFAMKCVGDPLTLKDAIIVLAQVCSTEEGFRRMPRARELIDRLVAICRFATTMSVRCVGHMAIAIIARNPSIERHLSGIGYAVMRNSNAYVSADGVPYEVAFAHMKASKSLSIAREGRDANPTPRQAYAEYTGADVAAIPRKVYESVLALANPVSREASKALLYKIMKRHPSLFVDPNVQQLCLTAGSTYRMRHAERKFLADLLENAQIAAAAPPKTRQPRT